MEDLRKKVTPHARTEGKLDSSRGKTTRIKKVLATMEKGWEDATLLRSN